MIIKINPEFKSIIPQLTQEEYSQLEDDIIAKGCLDSLKIWNGILLDGHNRYDICNRLNIPFKTQEMQFKNEIDVKEWIIDNQLARRNLSPYQRGVLALKKKDIIAERAKEKQRDSGGAVPQKSAKPHIDTREEIAKEAMVSHDTISKIELIEKKATPEIKEKLNAGELSIHKAYSAIKKEEIRAVAKQVEMPKGKYRIIYADPPWKYGSDRTLYGGDPEEHYPCMTIKELCAMPICDICENDSVLFLWVTSPILEESFDVISSWGFEYKTSFVWDKVKHNMGYYNSVRHELLLVCTRGSCLPDVKKLFDSVHTEERTEHSTKPEHFRMIIDTIYPSGKRIEIFARKQIKGWASYGNECKVS